MGGEIDDNVEENYNFDYICNILLCQLNVRPISLKTRSFIGLKYSFNFFKVVLLKLFTDNFGPPFLPRLWS